MTTDPAGQFHSPYNGMGNNPLLMIDPDGAYAFGPPGGGIYKTVETKWGQLNRQEKNIIKFHFDFYKVYPVYENSENARLVTKLNFGGNFKGDASDAFRHTFWQAINTQKVGADFTQKWSDAHEFSTPLADLSTDLVMDIHNNDVGIEIGENYPNASNREIMKIVLDKIKHGGLIIINKNNKLIKSNGSQIKNISEIRRYDTSLEIRKDILNENN